MIHDLPYGGRFTVLSLFDIAPLINTQDQFMNSIHPSQLCGMKKNIARNVSECAWGIPFCIKSTNLCLIKSNVANWKLVNIMKKILMPVANVLMNNLHIFPLCMSIICTTVNVFISCHKKINRAMHNECQ